MAFVKDIAAHWMVKGWLSRKQLLAIASIADRYGQNVNVEMYIGSVDSTWTKPYNDARKVQEEQAAELRNARRKAEAERYEAQPPAAQAGRRLQPCSAEGSHCA
ncbi:hypothetical protein LP420_04255 [Massilia sp. B-10]|nr:hypothetical protein LP420_04255 [Massilia sp. B-10]